ncbi:MAG: M14 family metallocarboxypeptidase [Myxococcales bacterium]|nr:M14 family metallocarboxypeptidase [Myxococcales bacterium]
MSTRFYPIGNPGQPWSLNERAEWLGQQRVMRSYEEEVLRRLEGLDERLIVEQYGALSYDPERYPLLSVQSVDPVAGAPWALVTGGVHGYETSGVQGALAFVHDVALDYIERLNLLVLPCVSPWAYEVINRWNPAAVDPNRSFRLQSPAEESAAVIQRIAPLKGSLLVHVDLHETTDTDESEFLPALAARDGTVFRPHSIPDGFYVVGDSNNPQIDFQKAIIERVSNITHIAPSDDNGQIIGSDVVAQGVILYSAGELGLCASVSGARFTTTTEVYPDSSKATPNICNRAQVEAIRSALDYALSYSKHQLN